MAYLYRHIRLDKNEPFYIGIGSGSTYRRAHSSRERTKFWKHIISKTSYRTDIILDDLTWEQACEKEREFIKLYGRRDLGTGILCNMTDGGEGAYGRVPTEKFRKKMSERMSGEKHPMYNKTHTPEAREKIAEAGKGRKMSSLTKIKLKEAQKNRIITDEFRKKISTIVKGRVPWNKGYKYPYKKIVSEETKKKISNSLKEHSVSEETRNKFSIALKGRIYPPEVRKRVSIGLRKSGRKRSVVNILTNAKYECVVDLANELKLSSNTIYGRLYSKKGFYPYKFI